MRGLLHVAGWSYDADGNLLYDGVNTYTYDAENRIASVNGEIGYAYDAEGNRVEKFAGTSWMNSPTVIYILTLDNKKLGDMAPSQENLLYTNIYAPGGRLLATYGSQSGSTNPSYTYNLTDWLGTKRVQISASGGAQETCISNPFGDGLSCTGGGDATEQHFTGKDRDVESSLDYFYARYYSSNMGRFMTPDWAGKPTAVPYANFGDPQSLNLYGYVLNNPLGKTDSDGHDFWDKVLNKIQGKGWVDTPRPPLPSKDMSPKVPSASLHTDMKGHTTTFKSTNIFGQTKTVQIETRNDVSSKAAPGAGDAFSTPNIGQVGNPNGASDAMGPKDAYINTGDTPDAHPGDSHSGREIHGGGTRSPDPQGPNQGAWVPTMGCTRGMNSDVISLGQSINATRSDPTENGAEIPYSRN